MAGAGAQPKNPVRPPAGTLAPRGPIAPNTSYDPTTGIATGDASNVYTPPPAPKIQYTPGGRGGGVPDVSTQPKHSGGPPPPGIDQQMWDAMHTSYDDQVSTINQMHDRALQHIGQLQGEGNASVNQYAGDTQAADHNLAAFARANGIDVQKAIKGAFSEGTKADQGFQNQLDHELRSRGVGGADAMGLHAELGGALAALRSQGINFANDSRSQRALLQQMLNDREAEGQTLKQGALNDIVIAGQNAKYAADQQAAADTAKARQAYDSGLISLKMFQAREAAAVAKAKTKAAKIPPLSLLTKASGTTDYSAAFNHIFNHTDPTMNPDTEKLAGPIFSQISSGAVSPTDALRVWLSKSQDVQDANPQIGLALRQAIADDARTQRTRRTATRYGSAYYGS